MSDEIEKVSITVADTRGSCTRIITDEYEVSDTCWPRLVEVFLEQLQGLGYKFLVTPEEMVDVLEDFHQELVCAECDGCEEEAPTVEEKKYPYTGVYENEQGITVVEFTDKDTGKCIYTKGHGNVIGEYNENWAEEGFEKVSK